MTDLDETIVAVASAAGGSMRGVLRLSGPDTGSICESCLTREDSSPPGFTHRCVVPTRMPLGGPGEPPLSLPGHLYFWPDQHSYTRQPSAEFHTVGSPPLLELALQRFCQRGARLALPGEFTMRAFLAGRLDLTQAEAVLGVIDAADPAQVQSAMQQLAGGLKHPLSDLRLRLIQLLADIEAGLDFVEDDIEFIENEEIDRQLAVAKEEIDRLRKQLALRDDHRFEPRLIICGRPNVGKSSLFNWLCGTDAALVSRQSGTTRDYLERRIDFGGQQVLLVDTAGQEAAGAGVEQLAQAQTDDQLASGQLELFCLDGGRKLDRWEVDQLSKHNRFRVIVITKSDLPRRLQLDQDAIEISSHHGLGLEELKQMIQAMLAELAGEAATMVGSTAQRCRESMDRAFDSLDRAELASLHRLGQEVVSFELRMTLEELGLILGATYTDDILDQVFGRFCIGK